jgi:thioredoxin reductase (NADPH)
MASRKDPEENQAAEKQAAEKQAKLLLKSIFDQLPRKVEILLFTGPGRNETYCQVTRQILQFLADLSEKISFKEYDVKNKLAEKYQVTTTPAIVLDPDHVHLRWLGAPIGHEEESFFLALSMISYGKSGLGDQALKILKEIKEPRRIRLFVSPTCPYCPQQVRNALQVAVEKPDLVLLEIIDVQVNPALAEQYDALSTPTTYANEKLIAHGAQPGELFIASLKKLEEEMVFIPDNDAEQIETDLVIVGGGPAGLTAGIYGARSGLKTVVVEKGPLGGQVATTPIVENYPGLTQVGGKALVDIMVLHALEYVNIFPGEEVIDIKPGPPLIVTTNRRRFITRAVLLATGAVYRHLGVPGEERLAGRGVSYCSTCDGPLFKDRPVIMVGGGNSAVTEALHLYQIGVKVTLVHRRNALRAQAHLIESLRTQQIPLMLNTEVKEIRGENRVQEVELFNNQSGESRVIPVNGVFIAVGYKPSVELARRTGVELTNEGFIKRDDRHRTNLPGIYSAGDVEGGYKQIVTAAGQGAEAALAIFEDLVNPYWVSQPVIPAQTSSA